MTTRNRKLRIAAIVGAAAVAAGLIGATQFASAAEPAPAARKIGGISLPENLKTAIKELKPAGNVVPVAIYLAANGSDVQNYTCGADGVFPSGSTPEASLSKLIGAGSGAVHHFGGPRWEDEDGSIVKGTVAVKKDVAGQLPWLLITTEHEGKTGNLTNVSAINRVLTSGGTAPTTPCTPNEVVAVPYAATYIFWAPASPSA